MAEPALAKGTALTPVPGLDPAVSVARIALDQPGLVQLSAPPAGLAWADRPGRAFAPAGDLLASGDGGMWLAAEGTPTLKGLSVPLGGEGLRFTLPADTAAVLSRGGEVLATLWSGDSPGTTLLESEADRLVLARAVGGAASAGVSLARAAAPVLRVGDGAYVSRSFATAGTVRLAVALSEAERAAARGGLRPRVAGAGGEATLVERSGRVAREADPAVREDGIVEVRHGPGLVAVWLDAGVAATRRAAAQSGPPDDGRAGPGRRARLRPPTRDGAPPQRSQPASGGRPDAHPGGVPPGRERPAWAAPWRPSRHRPGPSAKGSDPRWRWRPATPGCSPSPSPRPGRWASGCAARPTPRAAGCSTPRDGSWPPGWSAC